MGLTISLAQFQIELGKPDANLSRLRDLLPEAARRGSQILLLPELWTTGYDLTNAAQLARVDRSLLADISQLAAQYNMVISGSMLLGADSKVFNTFVYQTPDGTEPITYAKVHLFRLMDEHRWLAPGDHLQQVRATWGSAGLSICYDLRFPEMYRQYALAGVELFLISAEWPAARVSHWQTLLRARAIENQCFIAATNACRVTGGETFGGRSAIISPWGDVLVEGAPDLPDLLTAAIDLDQVSQARERIPILQDRRPDLYY